MQAILICPQVSLCFSVRGKHTPDRWERLRAHRGPISPVCSEGLFITASRGEQYSAARQLHLLPFSLILSLSPLLKRSAPPDFPQCTTARLWSRDWLQRALQGFKAVATAYNVFSLPLFFICHVSESENKPDILVLGFFFFSFFLGITCGLWAGTGGGKMGRDRRQKPRCSLHLKDANTLRYQRMGLEWRILS